MISIVKFALLCMLDIGMVVITYTLKQFPSQKFHDVSESGIGCKPFCISLGQASRQIVSAAAIDAALSFFQKKS